MTLGFDAGRLYLDVTAEVPVASYPEGAGPDPARVAGVDLGIIHPYAVRDRAGSSCWCRAGHPGRVPPAPARPQGPHPRRRPARPQAGTARVAPVAAAPPRPRARPRPGTGAASARPARGRQDRRVLGGGTPVRDAGGRRPARRAEPRRGAAAQPADPGLAGRAPHPCRERQGRGGRDHRHAGRRAGHVIDVPRLLPAGTEARRKELPLPALRARGAPRPGRGGQHRRPQRRRHHPHARPGRGDHAPPSRGTPAGRAPGPT